MSKTQSSENSDKKIGLKNENVTIEININEKGGRGIENPIKKGALEDKSEKAKEKAKSVIEDIKEKEKEIDLLEVTSNVAGKVKDGSIVFFGFIARMLKIFFIVLYRFFIFGLNSWKFIVIVGAIGGISISYLYTTSRPYYNSDGYGISRITNSQEIIQIINSISIPNDSLNIDLKNDLKLRPDVYNNIRSIGASWLIDLNNDGIADIVDYENDYKFDLERDTIAARMEDRFNVRLQVWDQSITGEVQAALLTYLNNQPFIKNLNASRLNALQSKIQIYSDQANVLDSLQYYEYFIEKQQLENNFNGLKFGEFELKGSEEQKDKRLYYENIIELKESALENSTSLVYNAEPIMFVGNLKNTTKRANGLMSYAKRVGIILIPFALVFFIIYRRKEFETIFDIKEYLE